MADNPMQQPGVQVEGGRFGTASPIMDGDGWDTASKGSLEPVSFEFFDRGTAGITGAANTDSNETFSENSSANTPTPELTAGDTASVDALVEAVVEETKEEVVVTDEWQPHRKREAVEVPTFSRRRKKPKGMPKRSLSAYNLYFQRERQKIMDQQQQQEQQGTKKKLVSFEELGKIIGKRWRDLSARDREEYESLASQDSIRYRKEMEVFNEEKKKRILHIDGDNGDNHKKPPAVNVFALSTSLSAPPPASPQYSQDYSQQSHRPGAASTGALYGPPPDEAGLAPLYRSSTPHHASYSPSDRYPAGTYPPVASAHSPTPRFPVVDLGSFRGSRSMPPLPSYYPPSADGHHDGSHPPPIAPFTEQHHRRHHPQQQPPPPPQYYAIPPGMELMLPDRDGRERRFRVEYSCFKMPLGAAQDYIDRLSGALSRHSTPPHAPPSHRRVGGSEEGLAFATAGYRRCREREGSPQRQQQQQLSPKRRR